MTRLLFKTVFYILIVLILTLSILSTTGITTDKFNKLILKKINNNYKDTSLELEKIKFKFDIKDISLFIETKNPKINYQNLVIPIENAKVYLNFISLLKSKIQIDKMSIYSQEINIQKLKNLMVKLKPSNINSLIINKVESGKININLDLYFDSDFEVSNLIAKGNVKEIKTELFENLFLSDTSFDFFFDTSDIIIKNTKTKIGGALLEDGNFYITRDNDITLKSEFSSELNLDKENLKNYLKFFKGSKFKNNLINIEASLDHVFNVKFDKTLKLLDFNYSSNGNIKNLSYDLNVKKNDLFKEDIKKIRLKNSKINFKVNSKKNYTINSKGKYSLNNGKLQNYELINNLSKNSNNLEISFDTDQELDLDIINFKKPKDSPAKITLNIVAKDSVINFKEIEFKENKNLIRFENLKINKKDFVSLKTLKVKTFIKNNPNNDFEINFNKKINIKGTKYDAKNLNKLINKKSNKGFLKSINKDIEINIDKILTPMSKEVFKFRLIGSIEKGKFVKISSKGDFGNNQFLDISMKSDKKNKKKYLEIYSDLPQTLLSDYNFFKGVSGGVLVFTSIIDNESSNSKLTIENFKVVNAPAVVKLLSIADFGGLADLAEGEGLSFDKLEINMKNEKDLLTLEELFAIGPSISVLMEGYKDKNGLVSLRGTLVPAKNLNTFLSKIPVIGKIIIPKEVGEGLFGVSFKMKGSPGKIKTSINPVKTLTPRFISKALEKSKESK